MNIRIGNNDQNAEEIREQNKGKQNVNINEGKCKCTNCIII